MEALVERGHSVRFLIRYNFQKRMGMVGQSHILQQKLLRTNWQLEYDLDIGQQETIDRFSNEDNLRLYKPDVYNV